MESSSESGEPIDHRMLCRDKLPEDILNLASELIKSIDQSLLCTDYRKNREDIETCFWGFSNGRREGDCKHPVVRLIDSCSTMDHVDPNCNIFCCQTKRKVDVMQRDLVVAKKALKVYAFYDWVVGQMGATSQSAAEKDNTTGPPLRDIRVNFNLTSEFRRLKRENPGCFGGGGGMAMDMHKSRFEKFVQDYEGRGSGDDWRPGKIVMDLDDRMIGKAKKRGLWQDMFTVIDFYSREVPGPCHPIYCPAIPIDKLSRAAKIDLAGGSVIPGIEWAFNEPTAQPDAVPGQE